MKHIYLKIAERHLLFRWVYGWYFRWFRFDRSREYGSCMRVETADLDEKVIAEKFAWLINMLIPADLHCKIRYVKYMDRGNGIGMFDVNVFDTIGWVYDGTVAPLQHYKKEFKRYLLDDCRDIPSVYRNERHTIRDFESRHQYGAAVRFHIKRIDDQTTEYVHILAGHCARLIPKEWRFKAELVETEQKLAAWMYYGGANVPRAVEFHKQGKDELLRIMSKGING